MLGWLHHRAAYTPSSLMCWGPAGFLPPAPLGGGLHPPAHCITGSITRPPALGAPSVDLLPLWLVQLSGPWFSFLGSTELEVSAVRACWMAPATPRALGLPLAPPCPGLGSAGMGLTCM